MKKYFILAAAAVVAMAACSKVETIDNTPDSPIRFSVVNHLQQTKATTGLTYPTTVPFGTFAWWTQNTWENTADDAKKNFVFMDNEQISWHALEAGAAEVWAPVNLYYWTKTGKITFASYSPDTADGTDKGYSEIPVYNVAKGFLFNDYTIVDATNVDLMWANLAANCSKTTNTDGTEVYDGTTGVNGTDHGYAGVPTIFNHALCQVGFEFRAIGRKNPNVSEIKIEVTDVDIVNIDNKGSFTQIPAETTPATPRWATDHANATANYDYAPAAALVLDLLDGTDNSVVSATNNYTPLRKVATDTDPYTRILLPQALLETADANNANVLEDIATTNDQKLVVKYTIKIKYTSSNDWATEDVVSTVRLNNGTIAAWADNQNITYRISINPYATIPVTFDPAIVDWTDVYSTDVNINEFDD